MNAKRFLASVTCAAAVLFSAVQAGAQTSQSVAATATVITPITAGATAPLAFGTVTKGQANPVAASAGTAGALFFSGDEADDIIITVPETATLTTTAGDGSATMSVTIARGTMLANSTDNVQGNAVALDASDGTAAVALSADTDGNGTEGDGLGQVYLWVGGSVSPTATQQRGDYSGSFDISASYSN